MTELLSLNALSLFDNIEKYDHVDLPLGAPKAKPTFLRGSSPDIYFGRDVGEIDGLVGTVDRAAYATGSGLGTIGINPNHFKIHAMPHGLLLVADALMEHLRESHNSSGMDLSMPFNVCSVKIHMGSCLCKNYESQFGKIRAKGTKVGLHRDSIWKKDGSWCSASNSTLENSPTIICSVWSNHSLIFQLQNCDDPNGQMNQLPQLCFDCKHGDFLLLHPQDEKTKPRIIDGSGIPACHWAHRVPGMAAGKLSVVFNFRCVVNQLKVHVATGSPVEPVAHRNLQHQQELNDVAKAWCASDKQALLYADLKHVVHETHSSQKH